MLAPVDKPLIQALLLDAPYRIAEIGCGGGPTALEILRRAPAGSIVHGFDISPTLIELARDRIRPEDRCIAFESADMGTAPPPEHPYNRLVSRFGVMFFDDPLAAFTNLAQWLAPGGRFAFAVWGPPAQNPWRTIVGDVVTELLDIPLADPEAPGPFRYSDSAKLLTLLDSAGFDELDVRHWNGSLAIGGEVRARSLLELRRVARRSRRPDNPRCKTTAGRALFPASA